MNVKLAAIINHPTSRRGKNKRRRKNEKEVMGPDPGGFDDVSICDESKR
jgi:hypothetical protein